MKTPFSTSFEIKVALLGFVSVGKTTILNALLRDKFSEVAMRRTTAAVNFFHISQSAGQGKADRVNTGKKEENDRANSGGEKETDRVLIDCGSAGSGQKPTNSGHKQALSDGESVDWSIVAEANRNAGSTFEEIKSDNAAFRESEEIHEKSFNIEVEEPICEMRKDTSLVLVDIPGVNEAGVGGKYKQYVAKKWDTFDCVIVVMDGRQGVNTEEQVSLLEFVKESMETKKDVPVIILCNKVDEPDDEEQAALVKEAKSEVERIFSVSNRDKALDRVVQASRSSQTLLSTDKMYPAFIATSAIHAFIYQTASLMTLPQFKKFDKDLIEKLGRDEVGKFKWKKMPDSEKFAVAHAAVSDPSQFQERLEATNFDKFLAVLSFSIGGSEAQLRLIQNQLDVAVRNLAPKKGITKQIQSIYAKRCVLGKTTGDLRDIFWKTYKVFEQEAFENFKLPTDVHHLSGPLEELLAYMDLARICGWSEEGHVGEKIKGLLRRQLAKLFNQEQSRDVGWACGSVPVTSQLTWENMSPEDWKTAARSVLLLSHNRSFCNIFGQEILLLESLIDKIVRKTLCYACGASLDVDHCYCRNEALGFRVDDNESLVPLNETINGQLYRLKVPESFDDPEHWGHVAWKACNFFESLECNN